MLLDTNVLDERQSALEAALESIDVEAAAEAAADLSDVRVALVLAEAPNEAFGAFLRTLDTRRAAGVAAQLPLELAARILSGLESTFARELFVSMPADHAADLLPLLAEEVRDRLLLEAGESFTTTVDELASYSPESAGGVMSARFLTVGRTSIVGVALNIVRAAPHDLERSSYIYVVEQNAKGVMHPVGVVSVRDLVRFERERPIAEVMRTDVVAVRVDDSAVDAARLLRNRRLTMVPVLGASGEIAGVVTFDDAIDILMEDVAVQVSSASTDSGEESFFSSPTRAIRLRLPWMAANIFLNLGAVFVISGFEATIATIAILAAFLPMITDMGGNVGIQSLSVAIRSIALGEVRLRDVSRAVRKEISVGMVNGVALGGLFMLIAVLWQGDFGIGIIAGIALAVNVLVAGVVGGTIPFLVKRLGRDPAMMTGPVLTTITDITGVTIYLGLSTLFLLG